MQPPFKLRNSKCFSVSSLTLNIQGTSKCSDQTARMHRMVWAFAGRTHHIVGNLMLRLKIWNLACHLGHRNGKVLLYLDLHVALKPHTKFWFNPTNGLGYAVWRLWRWRSWQPPCKWEQNYLSILRLHVDWMPSAKFRLNQMYGSRGGGKRDVVYKFTRWLPWWPSWISEQNDLIRPESPCSTKVCCQ